ncbi:AAA family ATPase [Exilibacterium tricleocarpae]|uniref:AAA family ATPase n=1 Tax=Exilibacterium tricleocarpae TaxID=2591008 RepID=A0A545TUZ4_9GAMM|nr:AAA family ATPase [Exilibacterium tricleocarpae]TQV81037.1 AAA family ATPase [Exilibacterium tricleocarpae]
MYYSDTLPLIIGITGPIRAGKSTASKYLSEKYGYNFAPNARVLKSILEALGLPARRDLLAATGDAIFADLGRDIIARARVAQVQAHEPLGDLRYVIDGIRYIEEIEVYKTLNNFKLIAISASDDIRYIRAKENIDTIKDGELSASQFQNLNNRQSERYVEILMNCADHRFENVGTEIELKYAIDSFMSSFY